MKNKISVLLPAYNRPEYLKEAIFSVLGQTFTDFELIISDDHSPTDLTGTVKSFKDERIKFYRQKKNLGFIKNWNFCISKSSGEYITIMGDDDVLLPNFLEETVKVLNKNPEISFVCCNFETIDQRGEKISDKIHNDNTFRLARHNLTDYGTDFTKKYFQGKRPVGLPSAVLFRKSMLDQTGLFDEKAGCPADVDMWIRLALISPMYYLDKILVKMRWHGSNLSKTLIDNPFPYMEDFEILFKHFPSIRKNISFRDKLLIFVQYARKPLGTLRKNPKYRKFFKAYMKDLKRISRFIFLKK
jgi:glycosyltransferase involved in cell wall biosynthesis